MRVTPDYLTSSAGARRDGTGDYVTRAFLCAEISTSADNVLLACMADARVPRVGDAHPRRGDLVVLDLDAQFPTSDPGHVVILANYGPPSAAGDGAVIGQTRRSLRSELITEETFEDINGVKMTTRYISRFAVGGGASITVSEIVHTVEVQRPSFSLVFERIEKGLPDGLAFVAAGAVNVRPWRRRGADQWLLNIESVEENDERYRTTYTATYNRNGWQATVNHTEGGIIPLDVEKRNGIHTYQVYPRFDFNALRLR